MYKTIIQNHTLILLSYLLVLVMGFWSYAQMPREKNPQINFNWIQVITAWPGTAAAEVEKLVTNPLEDAIAKIGGVRYVSSESKEGISRILVRFEEMDERTYERRVADLRREIRSSADQELPEEAKDPVINEATSNNAFPTFSIAVSALADDENLRQSAQKIATDLERISGVDTVLRMGLNAPELQIRFHPERLEGLGITPTDLSDSVRAHFQDVSAGILRLPNQQWAVRLVGSVSNPEYLAQLPVLTAFGEIPLGTVAEVERSRAKPLHLVRFNGRPAVLMGLTKRSNVNTLELIETIKVYIDNHNAMQQQTGMMLTLIDDQTVVTTDAIAVMESNAIGGLILVFIVVWFFMGMRLALLIILGIPFSLAGTFWVLSMMGYTLNNSVLLGIVIALGMLVDDAVVITEAVIFYLRKNLAPIRATMAAISEVGTSVVSSSITTMASFLPLILMPGVLGQFMRVVPLVVTVALLVSLVEAFFMLVSHLQSVPAYTVPSRIQRFRTISIRWLEVNYIKWLIPVLRAPVKSYTILAGVVLLSVLSLFTGIVKLNFFAFEPYRLYYINLKMPPDTSLERTLEELLKIETKIKATAQPGEIRETAVYAGQAFTPGESLNGEHYGQVMVSLNPHEDDMRSVDEIIQGVRAEITRIQSVGQVSVLRLSDGPPEMKPVNIKVRGTDYKEIRAAVADIEAILRSIPAINDIEIQDNTGRMELILRMDVDAVRRAGLNPASVARVIRVMVDGEVVARVEDGGEKISVRVVSDLSRTQDIDAFLRHTIALPKSPLPGAHNEEIPLGQILHQHPEPGASNLYHHQFQRAVTIQSDLNKDAMNVVAANNTIERQWKAISDRHPQVNLSFSGEMDDVKESMDAILVLFLLGTGLIFLILGAQFRNLQQPFIILTTVPMAAVGVVLGLVINRHPLSLFSLYGVVALAGIAVNSAIVLISVANETRRRNVGVVHAIIYASRRRLIPILITSVTTIAGLYSLAAGWGGYSLMWSPVASAIVWGLGFSTLLTLFVIPLLYCSWTSTEKPNEVQHLWQGDASLVAHVTRRVQELKRQRQLKEQTKEPAKEVISVTEVAIPEQEIGQREVEELIFGLVGHPAPQPTAAKPEPKPEPEKTLPVAEEGIQLLKDGKVVEGIRFFEKAANDCPNDPQLNLYAAYSFFLYMQEYGWDEGFGERGQRYLDRAGKLDPNNRQYWQLLQQYKTLQQAEDQD